MLSHVTIRNTNEKHRGCQDRPTEPLPSRHKKIRQMEQIEKLMEMKQKIKKELRSVSRPGLPFGRDLR